MCLPRNVNVNFKFKLTSAPMPIFSLDGHTFRKRTTLLGVEIVLKIHFRFLFKVLQIPTCNLGTEKVLAEIRHKIT
jgi:hypothetical protein